MTMTSNGLQASAKELASAQVECMQVATDREATVTAREVEMTVTTTVAEQYEVRF